MRRVIQTQAGALTVSVVECEGVAAVCLQRLGSGPERCIVLPACYLADLAGALADAGAALREQARPRRTRQAPMRLG